MRLVWIAAALAACAGAEPSDDTTGDSGEPTDRLYHLHICDELPEKTVNAVLAKYRGGPIDGTVDSSSACVWQMVHGGLLSMSQEPGADLSFYRKAAKAEDVSGFEDDAVWQPNSQALFVAVPEAGWHVQVRLQLMALNREDELPLTISLAQLYFDAWNR